MNLTDKLLQPCKICLMRRAVKCTLFSFLFSYRSDSRNTRLKQTNVNRQKRYDKTEHTQKIYDPSERGTYNYKNCDSDISFYQH